MKVETKNFKQKDQKQKSTQKQKRLTAEQVNISRHTEAASS